MTLLHQYGAGYGAYRLTALCLHSSRFHGDYFLNPIYTLCWTLLNQPYEVAKHKISKLHMHGTVLMVHFNTLKEAAYMVRTCMYICGSSVRHHDAVSELLGSNPPSMNPWVQMPVRAVERAVCSRRDGTRRTAHGN